jgi:ferric-dicitrate binding protein FerR (iron transport regulator)
MDDHQRLRYLLEQVQHGRATLEDYRDLRALITSDRSGEIIGQVHAFYAGLPEPAAPLGPYDLSYWDAAVKEILAVDKVREGVDETGEGFGEPREWAHPAIGIGRQAPFLRRSWWWAAAAVFLIIVAGTAYLSLKKKASQPLAVRHTEDILPGHNGAVLHLSDGSMVMLDSAQNGTVARQGSIAAVKVNGELKYVGNTNEAVYNTITTNPGRQWRLSLSDGTKVWLNAASSIHYPLAFNGAAREVEITGEAYFEVSPDASQPFIVNVGNERIRVLGTHFNVNAYTDEGGIKATLFEGSVKVSKGDDAVVLKPGQQSRPGVNGRLNVVNNLSMEEIIAWKDGYFHFESADLKTILRQFARWYDVDIIYDGPVNNRKFFGIVKRNASLKRVLEMLQDNNIIYNIEGKKLIVRSK